MGVMAITPFPQPDPAPADAAGAVAAACSGIDGVADVLWSARADEELVAGVEEIQQLKAKAAALEASLLAEIDAREIPRKQLAWGSTADWYTHLAGTTRGEGKRTVKHARELVYSRETSGQLARYDFPGTWICVRRHPTSNAGIEQLNLIRKRPLRSGLHSCGSLPCESLE